MRCCLSIQDRSDALFLVLSFFLLLGLDLLLGQHHIDFFIEFAAVKDFDNRLIQFELLYPVCSLIFTDQVPGFVAPRQNEVIIGDTGFA